MLTETGNQDEPMLPSKRKLPISEENEENPSNKAQKLQSLNHDDTVTPNKETVTPSTNSSSNISIADGKSVAKTEAEENADKAVDEEEKEKDEEGDDDFEDEEEKENGKLASVDRKGKGIMIEEDDDSDSDDDDNDDSGSDDSSDGMESEGSDLEDDPLAEVDLGNILPSRTRRRVVKPGVRIANDVSTNEDNDSDD